MTDSRSGKPQRVTLDIRHNVGWPPTPGDLLRIYFGQQGHVMAYVKAVEPVGRPPFASHGHLDEEAAYKLAQQAFEEVQAEMTLEKDEQGFVEV